MKSSLTTTGSALAVLGVLFDASAGERVTMTPVPKTRAEISSSGYKPIHQYQGDLSVEKAVEIALRQNPDILRAVHEIERTRGLIIEVRAQALPQITLHGIYNQQDRRLLAGGGSSSSFGNNGNSSGSSVVPSSTTASTSTSTTTPTTGTTSTGSTSSTGLENTTIGPQTAAAPVNKSGQTAQSAQAAGPTSADIQALTKALASAQNSGPIQNKSWQIAIQAQQVIYAGGQIRAALNIARLTEDSSYYQLRNTIDAIISQVRQQFYTVLTDRALITVQEEAVTLAKQQLTDQQNRFEAGTVPRFNVLQAEVSLSNTLPVLIRARNAYLIAELQLAKSLGLDPGPGGKPTFYCVGDLSVSERHISLGDSIILARARRPFLKVQRQQILIEVEQIKVAKAGYKPRIDANAGWEVRNRSASDDLSDTVNGWFFGVTGNWAIFDGFETFGQVKQARALLESSKVTYEDSVQQVELEVQTAYANLQQAWQTIQSQQKNVEQAREALRLAQERLAAGAGTQLDVLDARTALTRAQSVELQSRGDYNVALAEFDRATATDTVYDDTWRDPLAKQERSIMEKIATIGMPTPGTGAFEKRVERDERKSEVQVERIMDESHGKTTPPVKTGTPAKTVKTDTRTKTVKADTRIKPESDAKSTH